MSTANPVEAAHNRRVGERICEARKRACLTQSALAELTERTPSNASKWEAGHHTPPLTAFLVMSRVLGVSPSWLACLDDDPRETAPLKPAAKPEPALPSWVLTAVEAYAPRCPVCTLVHQHAKGDSNA